jgi:hypothetical protein
MPLKGSLLSTQGYIQPGIRPMADLDLLIRPVDKTGFTELLLKRGYQLQESENVYSKHDRFLRAGEKVVSWDGEHPDNPRPVEVHTEIRRRLWGDIGNFDISRWLWSGSMPGLVLGEPAYLPTIENLLLHVALHATENLLVGTGRLLQWLDLACLITRVPNLDILPFRDHLFPSISLAKRVFPNQLAGVNLSNIASMVHPRLVSWVESTPINSRCGLVDNVTAKKRTRLMKRWARWRPDPWRLAVGYGNIPLLKAYQLHILALARSLQRVGRIKLSRTALPVYPLPEN